MPQQETPLTGPIFTIYAWLEEVNAYLRRVHTVSFLLTGFAECPVEHISTSEAAEVGELLSYLSSEAQSAAEKLQNAVDTVKTKIEEA